MESNIQNLLRRLFYRFIQRPLIEFREKWICYLTRLAITNVKLAENPETGCQSSAEPQPEMILAENNIQTMNRFSIFLSAIASTLGLGQIWRFPTMAYEMGGGTFFYIYTILTLSMGYSLYFLNLANGQYSSKNLLTVFDKAPLMQGLGISMLFYSSFFILYYNQMVGFGVHYFTSSFNFILPWTVCPNSTIIQDSTYCHTHMKYEEGKMMQITCNSGVVVFNLTKICNIPYYAKNIGNQCCGYGLSCEEFNLKDICYFREHPSVHYWSEEIVQISVSEQTENVTLGEPILKLLLGSFAAWFLAFFCTIIGVKTAGMLTLLALPLLVIVLGGILAVITTMEGAMDGVLNFFCPDIKSLKNPHIWLAAVEQSLYSLGIAMGPITILGSQSRFKNPAHIDSLCICVSVVLVSTLTGSVVFAIIGVMANSAKVPFYELLYPGPSLTFITYAKGLTVLPHSWLFSIIFFFSYIVMGITTTGSFIESISLSIFKKCRGNREDKNFVCFLLIVFFFLLGCPMAFRGGVYIIEIIDALPCGLALVHLATCEVLAIIVFYGLGKFCEDITFMLGFYPNRYFRYTWMIAPFIFISTTIYNLIFLDMPNWNYSFIILGWILYAIVLSPTVVVFLCQLSLLPAKRKLQIVRKSLEWPRTEKLWIERREFRIKRKIF